MMLKNMLLHLFVTMFLLLSGCSMDGKSGNMKFVVQYESENFDDFANRSFFVRDFDREGNPIVLVLDDRLNNQRPCGLSIGFIVDKKAKTIKDVKKSMIPDSCNIDIKTSGELAVRFIEYDINRLAVDSNKNVRVIVKFKERDPDQLIRFSDLKYKTEEYKDWQQVKGNWYEKK